MRRRNLLPALLLLATACAVESEEGAQNTASVETHGDESTPDTTSNESSAMPTEKLQQFATEQGIDTSSPNWRTSVPRPPQQTFGDDTDYFWDLQTTEGNIKVKLMPEVAPMHVTSTIYLTQLGFYDDLKFHRVIQGFMAQGGCPLGTGTGGPGYKYDGEFDPSVRHDRPGLLSIANAGPGTDGSQFFITFVPTPHLDGKHTIFGEVVEGMETVQALEAAGGGASGRTSKPLSIVKASISTAAK